VEVSDNKHTSLLCFEVSYGRGFYLVRSQRANLTKLYRHDFTPVSSKFTLKSFAESGSKGPNVTKLFSVIDAPKKFCSFGSSRLIPFYLLKTNSCRDGSASLPVKKILSTFGPGSLKSSISVWKITNIKDEGWTFKSSCRFAILSTRALKIFTNFATNFIELFLPSSTASLNEFFFSSDSFNCFSSRCQSQLRSRQSSRLTCLSCKKRLTGFDHPVNHVQPTRRRLRRKSHPSAKTSLL